MIALSNINKSGRDILHALTSTLAILFGVNLIVVSTDISHVCLM